MRPETPHYEEAIGRTHRAQVDEDERRRWRQRDVRVSVASERTSERAVRERACEIPRGAQLKDREIEGRRDDGRKQGYTKREECAA